MSQPIAPSGLWQTYGGCPSALQLQQLPEGSGVGVFETQGPLRFSHGKTALNAGTHVNPVPDGHTFGRGGLPQNCVAGVGVGKIAMQLQHVSAGHGVGLGVGVGASVGTMHWPEC